MEKKNLKLNAADKVIEEKIRRLQQEMQMHQMRLNNAQQVVNVETRNLVAKNGAIAILQELKETKI